jgi:hypothetical protein
MTTDVCSEFQKAKAERRTAKSHETTQDAYLQRLATIVRRIGEKVREAGLLGLRSFNPTLAAPPPESDDYDLARDFRKCTRSEMYQGVDSLC